MAIPKTTRMTSMPVRAYHEVAIDFASTAAEATSAAATGVLPKEFTIDRPIFVSLKPGQTAMDDNALLLAPSFTLVTGRVNYSMKFANNNVAAGAAIDPASKTFVFMQF